MDEATDDGRGRRRRRGGGGGWGTTTTAVWEKLDDGGNEWMAVPPSDLLRLTRLEGEPWLAIFHVIASGTCRTSYRIDGYRRSRLMRLRGYVNETLIDQLPILADVARCLDELSILGGGGGGDTSSSSSSSSSGPSLLLRRVDTLRESIAGGRRRPDDGHWETIARRQWDEIFSRVTDSKDEDLRRIAEEVYGGAGDAYDVIAGDASGKEDDASPINGEENGPGMERGGRIAEDWRVALSGPIEKVILRVEEDGGGDGRSISTFELVPARDPAAVAITDTPSGPFRRLRMSISRTSGESEAIFPHAKVEAIVRFRNDPSSSLSSSSSDGNDTGEVALSVDSLSLPTVVRADDAPCDSYDEVGIELPGSTFPPKEWRQLGEVERESVVIQLGFKRLPRGVVPAGSSLLRGYILSQAFVSQPLAC